MHFMLIFFMKKNSTLICFLLFYLLTNINSLYADELYPGEIVSGKIGKYGLGTSIILPTGNWEVAGIAKKNGTIRPVEIILIQRANSIIKSIFQIRYARDFGLTQGWDAVYGWRPEETFLNNTCDDYKKQRSNFHYKKIKKKSQQLIVDGECIAVYAINDFYKYTELQKDNSLEEAFNMTDDFIMRNKLEYPNALVFIDNTYFSEKNYVQTYYAVNPELSDVKSSPGVYFNNSEWHRYNIDHHPQKKSFMDKAIFAGKQVFNKNINNFQDRKPLDFSSYAKIFN